MKKSSAVASLIYALIFVGVLLLHPGGPVLNQLFLQTQGRLPSGAQNESFSFLYKAFQNVYQILPPLFAAICGLVYGFKGRHDSRIRRVGWIFMGLAALSFASGQTTWSVMESGLRLEMPAYGLPDIGYLATYPFLFCGVILLFGSMPVTGRSRLLIDCALISGSVGVLSWYFLVQGWWNQSDVLPLGKLIFSSYPLGDIASLFGALVLYRAASSDRVLQRSIATLATGLLLLAFADTTFSYYNMLGLYQTGSWFDWGWSFGWMVIGWASLAAYWNLGTNSKSAHVENQISKRSLPRSLWRIVEPYLAVAAAIGVITLNDYLKSATGDITLPVFLASSFLISLVILRQVLTLIENQHLTAQLRGFTTTLEQRVQSRTQQLAALHQLTKAVNNTLQVDQVLSAALTHASEAMQGDAVVIKTRGETASPAFHHSGFEGRPEALQHIENMVLSNGVESVSLPFAPQITPKPVSAQAKADPNGGGSEGLDNYLQAPLIHRGEMIGVIGVARWNGSFGRDEPEALESIGVEIGTAYENSRLYAAALEAADRDPVTALFNHRAIHQRLDSAFNLARQEKSDLSVIMMDLNNFKLFNDTYGHPVGDQVLKRVADALRADCRLEDIIGRYGGDEFIVVLPGADGETARAVAQRLRESMTREGFRRAGDQRTIPVTLSFGIAVYPHDAGDRHELLTLADANLYNAKLSEGGIHSTSDVQRKSRQLKTESSFNVLDSMVVAVDNKDRYTRRHSEDVTEYSLWIAEELGLSPETQRIIRVGSLLHDIGKIGVPEDILRKPGRLTPEEYQVLKQHPHLGSLIVSAMPDIEPITDIVRSHHERFDGLGYPDGLSGQEIPMLGRLVAVADAFSAMTTQRPYREGLAWEEALSEIERNIGTQFDPEMAGAFLRAAQTRRAEAPANKDAESPQNSPIEENLPN